MARIRQVNSKAAATASTDDSEPEEENLELTEEEQWRIVNETGVLKQFAAPHSQKPPDETEEALPLAEEIFNATLFVIPILVHWQYGKRPTYTALADRMLPGVPILSIFIFYTTRYKRFRWMQSLFFLLSLAVGPRLIWLINMASWRVVMKQCPPLATIWVYTVVQLDLGPAVLSLAIIGGWLWCSGMKLVL
ncbi:uncharacterized protein C8Q71DRAFT_852325 [Rhodofomes roseus]|uniref:DUF7719 domain-containing protein n=1 Tax=Rhodofomes roseus TaxID=34475 RepID=A0ABQ8KYG4_9APHY|nr:uncharacterized protein C8Q71DRAFT_852325 [Rhodofomes roseus]KAH9843801.1 hypothetical protein C8Q71DRAFT_852325 [Rhodofomes roseus]